MNLISLKVGEELCKEFVTLLKNHEAAVVITAFDENGQASTESEKVCVSRRSYVVLVNEVKFQLVWRTM